MLFRSTLAAAVLLASGAVAQYPPAPAAALSTTAAGAAAASTPVASTAAAAATGTSPDDEPADSSPSGMVSVQVVKVSDASGSLTFSPNNIQAAPGSMVQFQFYPKNHSVVQSTFANPCVPIGNIAPNPPGLFSGFMPIAAGSNTLGVFTIAINDTSPIWFYCSQGRHCQSGMVGVINAPAGKTIDAYAAAAASAPQNLSPGQASSSDSYSAPASAPSAPPSGNSTSNYGSSPSSASTGGITLQTGSGAAGLPAGRRELAAAAAVALVASFAVLAL